MTNRSLRFKSTLGAAAAGVLAALLPAAPLPAQTPPAPASPSAPMTPELQAGRAAADAWLTRLDAGDYAGTWRDAAAPFQAAVDTAKWSSGIGELRAKYGKMLSRKLLVSRFSTTMPGGPDGRYAYLQYVTDFEHKQGAIETIVPMLDKDGRWKISGYYIK
jgi:hypothetical protein